MNNYTKIKPAIEPITLQQAKDHLNIDFTDDDSILELIIQSAREAVETQTGRALITRTVVHERDCLTAVMGLPQTAQSVELIEYLDTDGTRQTLAASEYTVDVNRTPAQITIAFNGIYPATLDYYNAVMITYKTGYGDNAQDVPAPLASAMLLMIGHLYENREATAPINMNTVPLGIAFLINPYRLYNF